jgi:tetratricopeptide (TPR) repeat protein
MTLPSAVALNNTAVSLLRDGQVDMAMQLLNYAWSALELSPASQDHYPGATDVATPKAEFGHVVETRLQNPPSRPLNRQGCPAQLPESLHIIELSPPSLACPIISESAEALSTGQHALPLTSDLESLSPLLQSITTQCNVIVHSVNLEPAPSSVLSMLNDGDSNSASPNNFFYLYKRAFIFDLRGQEANPLVWLRCVPQIPAVLLYNAGLIFHRLAVRNGSTSTFLKALELYHMSQNLLEGNTEYGLYAAELDVLRLALTNNMGHCYSHFNNVNETRNCLERMLVLFLFSASAILLTKEEYDFYHISILFGVCQKPVVSPAA